MEFKKTFFSRKFLSEKDMIVESCESTMLLMMDLVKAKRSFSPSIIRGRLKKVSSFKLEKSTDNLNIIFFVILYIA
jgi:hypothetical protein